MRKTRLEEGEGSGSEREKRPLEGADGAYVSSRRMKLVFFLMLEKGTYRSCQPRRQHLEEFEALESAALAVCSRRSCRLWGLDVEVKNDEVKKCFREL